MICDFGRKIWNVILKWYFGYAAILLGMSGGLKILGRKRKKKGDVKFIGVFFTIHYI